MALTAASLSSSDKSMPCSCSSRLGLAFADALRDLRAQALILLVAPAVPNQGRRTQGRRARVVERGRGTITGSLHGSRRGVDDRTGMRQWVLWRCGTCERSRDPGRA